MPRRPREINPDGIYHVATRGSDQRPLFLFDRDREEFLGRLGQATARYELTCLAYCLMDRVRSRTPTAVNELPVPKL